MKKVILIILLLSLFFALAGSVQAIDTIVKSYPKLPGAPEPTAGIPQYIRYIFIFSLGLVGITAFIAILLAAIGYVTSVGNPQKAADAKDKIFSALLGMLILLGSYVLLNTINPDLLKFKTEIVGEKVDIPVETEEGEEQVCRPTEAYWDKGVINVGENATLTFALTKECKNKTVEIICDKESFLSRTSSFFRQERPKGVGCLPSRLSGWNPYCGGYWNEPIFNHLNTKLTISYPFTFTGRCVGGLGITECPAVDPIIPALTPKCGEARGEICNFLLGKPEIFYIGGKCTLKVAGQTDRTFYVPEKKATIEVRDLLDDGTCCK